MLFDFLALEVLLQLLLPVKSEIAVKIIELAVMEPQVVCNGTINPVHNNWRWGSSVPVPFFETLCPVRIKGNCSEVCITGLYPSAV